MQMSILPRFYKLPILSARKISHTPLDDERPRTVVTILAERGPRADAKSAAEFAPAHTSGLMFQITIVLKIGTLDLSDRLRTRGL